MRYLITGGAGFIGSNFVRMLLEGRLTDRDASVVVLDKLTYAGNLENLISVATDSRYRFVQGDICDAELVSRLVADVDCVVNFAAETHVDRSISGPADFILTNVLGAQTVLEACRAASVKRVVHIGTDEVYGSIASGSWTEEWPLLPNSPYSAAKASAEMLARAYFITYGLNVSTTRCSNNYGHFQYPEKVIPLFLTNLIDGKHVPLYGEGKNVRDWLHVDDHCRGIDIVLHKGLPGESYNIGGGVELTNRELTERLLSAMGVDWSYVDHVPDRLGHDLRYSVDDSKIRLLGYMPQRSFDEALAETVEWYKSNESWWRPLKSS